MSENVARQVRPILLAIASLMWLVLTGGCGGRHKLEASPSIHLSKPGGQGQSTVSLTHATSSINYPGDLQWPMWGRSARHDLHSPLKLKFGLSPSDPDEIGQRWLVPSPGSETIPYSPVIDQNGALYYVAVLGGASRIYKLNPYNGNKYLFGTLAGGVAAAPLIGADLRLYVLTSTSAFGFGTIQVAAFDLQGPNAGHAAWSPITVASQAKITARYPVASGGSSPALFFAYQQMVGGSPQPFVKRLSTGVIPPQLSDVYSVGSSPDPTHDTNRQIISLALNSSLFALTNGYAGQRILMALNPNSGNPPGSYPRDSEAPLGSQQFGAPNNLMINSAGTVFEQGESWRIFTSLLQPDPPSLNAPRKINGGDYYINWLNEGQLPNEQHYCLVHPAGSQFGSYPYPWNVTQAQSAGLSGWPTSYMMLGTIGPAMTPIGGQEFHAVMSSMGSLAFDPDAIVVWGGRSTDDSGPATDAMYICLASAPPYPFGYPPPEWNRFVQPLTTSFNAPPVIGQIEDKTYAYITAANEGYVVALGPVLPTPQPAPQAAIVATPTRVVVGAPTMLDASGSSDKFSVITSYEWDWNWDGVAGDFTVDSSGSAAASSHAYGAAGTYRPAVRVRNSENLASAPAATTVRVYASEFSPTSWYREDGQNSNALYSDYPGPAVDDSQSADPVVLRHVTQINGSMTFGPNSSTSAIPAGGAPLAVDSRSYQLFANSSGVLTGGPLDPGGDISNWIGSGHLGDLTHNPDLARCSPAIAPNGQICFVGTDHEGVYSEPYIELDNAADGTAIWSHEFGEPDDWHGPFIKGPLITSDGGGTVTVVTARENGAIDGWRSGANHWNDTPASNCLWSEEVGNSIIDYCTDGSGHTYVLTKFENSSSWNVQVVRLDNENGGWQQWYVVSSSDEDHDTLGMLLYGDGSDASRNRIFIERPDSSLITCLDGNLTPKTTFSLLPNSTRAALRVANKGDGKDWAEMYVLSRSTNQLTKYELNVTDNINSPSPPTTNVLGGAAIVGFPTVSEAYDPPADASALIYVHGSTAIECWKDNLSTNWPGQPVWHKDFSGSGVYLTGEVMSISLDGNLQVSGNYPGSGGSPSYFEFGYQ